MPSMQILAEAVPQIAEEGKAGGAAAEKKSREREAFAPLIKRDAGDERGHQSETGKTEDFVQADHL